MCPAAHRSDVAVLLRMEHAVGRALARASDERDAFRALLPAIGEALGWDAGAVWAPTGDALRPVEVWRAPGAPLREDAAAADGLAGRAWDAGEPVWRPGGPDAEAALAWPVHGAAGPVAVLAFAGAGGRRCDDDVLDAVAVLGLQIGQFVERDRAQRAVRASDARKSAILDAAFDGIVTLDHHGRVVEANAAAERTFGRAAADLVGRELIGLVVPPAEREHQRRAFARFASSRSAGTGPRVELTALRSDGTEFPIDLAITRPDVPGPPLFCCSVRDLSERHAAEQALRRLAAEQAALRRVATAVASEMEPQRVFAIVTEEVGRLLDARSANMVRFAGEGTATVVGGWNAGDTRNVPVGSTIPLDGDTAAVRVLRTGRPARVDDYSEVGGSLAELLRSLGFLSSVAAPVALGGALWGAVIVSSVEPHAFPPGAEQRIADFAELVAQALANAQAREELAASRARIVEAADAERRRLERNLHDGAQQRLVSVSLQLGLVARRVEREPDVLAVVERTRDDLTQALEELRELARGIHPAVLTDRGLEPALASLAARAPLPVGLSIALDGRLPGPVEAAVYYVVAESLTNAARHAQASTVRVSVARAGPLARVEVADDGVGGAGVEHGSGLRGLADRVEALGGRFALESAAGAGTVVRAEIPAR